MARNPSEAIQIALDEVARGQLSRRGALSESSATEMLLACRGAPRGERAIAADENRARNQLKLAAAAPASRG